MGAEQKATARNATAPNMEADTADELEQIMNDIEELQEEMASEEAAETGRKAPAPKVSNGGAKARPALRAVTAEEDEEPSALSDEPVAADLEDFRGSAGDASMEETLGELETEEAPGGNLLDASLADSIEEDAEAEVAAAEEEVSKLVDELDEEASEQTRGGSMTKTKAMPTASVGDDGALTLSVAGAMTLKLRYEAGDQDVEVTLSPGALVVRLSDGSEFRIPIRGSGRQAA